MSQATQDSMPPFHLAFPVHSLEAARAFYGTLLGCPEGRSSPDWVDFNFYGHQIVAHLSPEETGHRNTSAVDGDNVPVRHFGAILQRRSCVAQVSSSSSNRTSASRANRVNRRPCFFSIRRATRWSSRRLPIWHRCLRNKRLSLGFTFAHCGDS